MIIKITGVVLCEILAVVFIRQYKSEYTVLVQLCGIVVIFFMIFSQLKDLLVFFKSALDSAGISVDYISSLIKALGIALVTQLATDLCKDNSETALAGQVEFAGKIIILGVSLPILRGIAQLILGIVEKI
ncbi:MAG: hypothetical protein IKJ88_01600 [Clostridia bacterium]|nr:hypothetical protein [Clostridia bacterium]